MLPLTCGDKMILVSPLPRSRLLFPTTSAFPAFATTAFPDLDLGDARLHRRFARVVHAALQHPEKSLPDKFHDPAAYQACLRLLHHPALSYERLLSCHQVALLDRLERRP